MIANATPARAAQKVLAPKGWAERQVFASLETLSEGSVTLFAADGDSRTYGARDASLAAPVTIHSPSVFSRLFWEGSMGAAAGYLDGEWDCDDLVSLFRIFCRNSQALTGLNSVWSAFARAAERLGHALRPNTLTGSKRNIHAHYDVGNEFFEKILDDTMMYSCGVFADESTPLRDASVAKLDLVCQKLDLSPRDHLLEIGTGWGGLAVHAARDYGCRVTTTTISEEQYAFAEQRIRDAGLSRRITLLKEDYRKVSGQFDKLVSIEMLEAVGRRYLPGFFRKCQDLLKPDGLMLLQSITIAEQHYAGYCSTTDFIQKYVFPGGFLPSTTGMLDAMNKGSDFRPVHFEDFAPHYALTLRRWRERLMQNRDAIVALGYQERFLRLWNYYLCYCEAGFLEQTIGLSQAIFARPRRLWGQVKSWNPSRSI